jgi:hypothetical protein
MWKPRRFTILQASTACYSDSFSTFFFTFLRVTARNVHYVNPFASSLSRTLYCPIKAKSLCLINETINHYAMKTECRYSSTILDLSTRWRWPASRHGRFIPSGRESLALTVCSSYNVRDPVSHPYRTRDKIIVVLCSDFYRLDSRREDKRFWIER